jgi:CheY-like chemotaxis protein
MSERRRATVLVYSSNATTRSRVIGALGVHPAPDLDVTYAEATVGAEVVARCDEGGIDLAILDGEAAPTGGIGLCRQLKDELDAPPPVLLLLGRRDDAWLATWAHAEGVSAHPVEAVRITEAALRLLAPAGSAVAGH